jgi:hypothetical protein
MTRVALTWDQLPLFASDEAIGEALLGRERFANALEGAGRRP